MYVRVCSCVFACVCVCVCVCVFGFYGIPTFEGYLMPNPFLYK